MRLLFSRKDAKTQRGKAIDGSFFDRKFKKELCISPERVPSKGMGEAHVLKITKNWQPCMGVIRYCGIKRLQRIGFAFFSQRRKDAKLLTDHFLIEYLKKNYVKALKG